MRWADGVQDYMILARWSEDPELTVLIGNPWGNMSDMRLNMVSGEVSSGGIGTV